MLKQYTVLHLGDLPLKTEQSLCVLPNEILVTGPAPSPPENPKKVSYSCCMWVPPPHTYRHILPVAILKQLSACIWMYTEKTLLPPPHCLKISGRELQRWILKRFKREKTKVEQCVIDLNRKGLYWGVGGVSTEGTSKLLSLSATTHSLVKSLPPPFPLTNNFPMFKKKLDQKRQAPSHTQKNKCDSLESGDDLRNLPFSIQVQQEFTAGRF